MQRDNFLQQFQRRHSENNQWYPMKISSLKGFIGMLRVHQITGNVSTFRLGFKRVPTLTTKSLGYFRDNDVCEHFELGTLQYDKTLNFQLMMRHMTQIMKILLVVMLYQKTKTTLHQKINLSLSLVQYLQKNTIQVSIFQSSFI